MGNELSAPAEEAAPAEPAGRGGLLGALGKVARGVASGVRRVGHGVASARRRRRQRNYASSRHRRSAMRLDRLSDLLRPGAAAEEQRTASLSGAYHVLSVTVCAARGVRHGAVSRVFARVSAGEEQRVTASVGGGSRPAWNAHFVFVQREPPPLLHVSLHSSRLLGVSKRRIGNVDVPLAAPLAAAAAAAKAGPNAGPDADPSADPNAEPDADAPPETGVWSEGGEWMWCPIASGDEESDDEDDEPAAGSASGPPASPDAGEGGPELLLHVQCVRREQADLVDELDFSHVLTVKVDRSRGLPPKAAAVVELAYGLKRFRTRPQRGGAEWNQACSFFASPEEADDDYQLALTVWNHGAKSGRPLGRCFLDVAELLESSDLASPPAEDSPDAADEEERKESASAPPGPAALLQPPAGAAGAAPSSEPPSPRAAAAGAARRLAVWCPLEGGSAVGGVLDKDLAAGRISSTPAMRSTSEVPLEAQGGVAPADAGEEDAGEDNGAGGEEAKLKGGSDDDGDTAAASAAAAGQEAPAVRLVVEAIPRRVVEDDMLAQVLRDFDGNGDGRMELDEVMLVLASLGAELPEEAVAGAYRSIEEREGGGEGAGLGTRGLLDLLLVLAYNTPSLGLQLLGALHAHVGAGTGSAMESSGGGSVAAGNSARHDHDLADAGRRAAGRDAAGRVHRDQNPMQRRVISVMERRSGLIVKENIPSYIRVSLKAMYGSRGSRLLSRRAAGLLATMSRRQGRKYDDPASAADIAPFVRMHDINTDEIERPLAEYATFNDFFARGLRPGARPVDEDPAALLSPADCRLTVFEHFTSATRLWVKGARFTVDNLLGPEAAPRLAARFRDGSLCIARLAPQDYHRWHCPVDALAGAVTPVDGLLYSVNPIAVTHPVDVFTENKRVVCELETERFGKVVLIAVGATMVGSINLAPGAAPGSRLARGDGHGEFRFGGSTVILLFERDRVEFDADLLRNSHNQMETLVRCNTRIGLAEPARE